jgi:hypothetical protein
MCLCCACLTVCAWQLNARYVSLEGRGAAATSALGEEGLWEGVGRDHLLSRLVRNKDTGTSSTQVRRTAIGTQTARHLTGPSHISGNQPYTVVQLRWLTAIVHVTCACRRCIAGCWPWSL